MKCEVNGHEHMSIESNRTEYRRGRVLLLLVLYFILQSSRYLYLWYIRISLVLKYTLFPCFTFTSACLPLKLSITERQAVNDYYLQYSPYANQSIPIGTHRVSDIWRRLETNGGGTCLQTAVYSRRRYEIRNNKYRSS